MKKKKLLKAALKPSLAATSFVVLAVQLASLLNDELNLFDANQNDLVFLFFFFIATYAISISYAHNKLNNRSTFFQKLVLVVLTLFVVLMITVVALFGNMTFM